MPAKKWFFTAVVIALCVAAVTAGRHFYGPQAAVSPETGDPERSKGKPSAKLWITEYLDYECQACARTHPIVEKYMKDHPGAIYLKARFHPMIGHRHSRLAAVYAACAARQHAFWPYHAELLTRQAEWVLLDDARPALRHLADGVAIDLAELDRCTADPGVLASVESEFAENRKLGVTATPSFFIDGKLVVGEFALAAELKKYFEEDGR